MNLENDNPSMSVVLVGTDTDLLVIITALLDECDNLYMLGGKVGFQY